MGCRNIVILLFQETQKIKAADAIIMNLEVSISTLEISEATLIRNNTSFTSVASEISELQNNLTETEASLKTGGQNRFTFQQFHRIRGKLGGL